MRRTASGSPPRPRTRGRWRWQIVDYIQGRCDDTLWPEIAAEVRGLIAANQPYAAIGAYFLHVGARGGIRSSSGSAVRPRIAPRFHALQPRHRALSSAS